MINKLHSLYCCMLVLIVTFWSGIDTYATTVKMQQDQKVKGIVVDEKGEVIIGATIQVIDSQERTVTNIDGEFTIPVSSNGHLSVSYIGYETQKIAIEKQKQFAYCPEGREHCLKRSGSCRLWHNETERNDFCYFTRQC